MLCPGELAIGDEVPVGSTGGADCLLVGSSVGSLVLSRTRTSGMSVGLTVGDCVAEFPVGDDVGLKLGSSVKYTLTGIVLGSFTGCALKELSGAEVGLCEFTGFEFINTLGTLLLEGSLEDNGKSLMTGYKLGFSSVSGKELGSALGKTSTGASLGTPLIVESKINVSDGLRLAVGDRMGMKLMNGPTLGSAEAHSVSGKELGSSLGLAEDGSFEIIGLRLKGDATPGAATEDASVGSGV